MSRSVLAAITKYCRLGEMGFITTEIYFSQLWGLEVLDLSAAGVRFWCGPLPD